MNTAKKRFFIETFGCQMNVNDSEKAAGLLAAEGHLPVSAASEADFVFVNTCAVREQAAAKLYHFLGRLEKERRRRPGLVVGVGGCVAQLEGESILARAPHVGVLVGTHNLARVPELLERAGSGAGPQVDLDRRADSFAPPAALVAHLNRYRAYVTVMEGCNHVCSFCVVPRTRGPEVCRSPDSIVEEVRMLVARGVPEIMLLGQTVNAYRHGSTDFADLLARVEQVPGLVRLRFTTSHPSHVSAKLARTLGGLGKLCPYVHLPVQSGSDRVLAGMRRGYTRAEYLDTLALLRAEAKGVAVSSDVIVGYPGETERDFEETLELVERAAFDSLFSFGYSPRPGTAALRLRDDVAPDEKRRRLHRVNDLQQERQARSNRARVGLREWVLAESRAGEVLSGRTPHFRIVHFEGPASLLGRVVPVEIRRAGPNSLVGSRLPEGA